MNDQTNFEKNPLDELFARRLGKLDRTPSADGFARLQQRMQGEHESKRVLVWWQNPSTQLAAAASVAVLLLFGWLYNGRQHAPSLAGEQPSVAVQQTTPDARLKPSEVSSTPVVDTDKPVETIAQAQPVDRLIRPKGGKADQPTAGRTDRGNQSTDRAVAIRAGKPDATGQDQPEVANEPSVRPAPVVAAAPAARPQAVERVLVVTIEEPEALVAARQTAASVVNNMPVLAASPSKEGKATFWQQVKRLKQDDDVARQEGPVDESGLLGRAYKGIKQRLEKDKPAKQ